MRGRNIRNQTPPNQTSNTELARVEDKARGFKEKLRVLQMTMEEERKERAAQQREVFSFRGE